MAVQAQYPSNLLFRDRGEMDTKEMDLTRPPPPPIAGVSPAAFFSNGANGNGRKPARLATATMAQPPAREEYINTFAVQPLAPLQTVPSSCPASSPTIVYTGLRLAFEDQQQALYSSSPSLFASFSDELAGEMKQQVDELDHFLRDQGEQLRRALAERRRRQYRALLVAADEAATRRLREKAAEAERAARLGAELEERLARLRAEAAAWQGRALAEQAAAVALHAQIQQAAAAARSCVEELASGEAGLAESASSAHVDPRRADSDGACRACRLRPAAVVLFPCRHLCLCGDCFTAGDVDVTMACPVCLCVRTGSVEAILS